MAVDFSVMEVTGEMVPAVNTDLLIKNTYYLAWSLLSKKCMCEIYGGGAGNRTRVLRY